MKKNWINVPESLLLLNEGYGLNAEEFNYYQIRLRPDETDDFYDWYHTTGSLVRNSPDRPPKKLVTIRDAEDLAVYIQKQIHEQE
jgi:hypothetical protein